MDAHHEPLPHYVLGEFATTEAVIEGALKLRERGFTDLDAYTPYPVHGLAEALGHTKSRVPVVIFLCGMSGAFLGYIMQYWMNAVDYPINVGGRPLHSAPAMIPITFECGVLLSALSAFLAVIAFSRLPQLYHPVFNAKGFERATIDRYWISARVAPERVAAASDALVAVGAANVQQTEDDE